MMIVDVKEVEIYCYERGERRAVSREQREAEKQRQLGLKQQKREA